MRSCDWKGKLVRRFRWRHLRFEYGRWCNVTDCCGETSDSWFEWEER